ERLDVLVAERRRETGHDRLRAFALLVLAQRLVDVRPVLTREARPLRRFRDAAFAVALHAGLRELFAGRVQLAVARDAARLRVALLAREVREEVDDILIRQRRGLSLHRLVRALPAAIGLQRDLEVIGVLVAELRHVIGRIGVVISWHGMAPGARHRELFAALGIPLELERHQSLRCRARAHTRRKADDGRQNEQQMRASARTNEGKQGTTPWLPSLKRALWYPIPPPDGRRRCRPRTASAPEPAPRNALWRTD